MERRNAWLSYGENEEKEMEQIAKSYKSFLDAGKTERECVTELIRQARGCRLCFHGEEACIRRKDPGRRQGLLCSNE